MDIRISIKKLILFLLCTLVYNTYMYAQGGTWEWVNGSTGINTTGNYGTQGVFSVNNSPPARYEPTYWTDLQGNFWMFGGIYYDSITTYYFEMNDLWKYDITINQWIWVSGPDYISNMVGSYGTLGIPSTGNYPSARAYGVNNWTDNNGDLWLYGGWGILQNGSVGLLNDLWRYNITTNEWTWVGGNNFGGQKPYYGIQTVASVKNNPGSVYESKSDWVDKSNNLWMFGGGGSYTGYTNVLWKYSISDNEWTWMKGDTTGLTYKYGTYNIEAPANLPPARWSDTRWKDAHGYFYIFGGIGLNGYVRNDVWRYNPSTNNWTWVAGDSTQNVTGQYTNKCQLGNGNKPAARYENASTQNMDCHSLLWTFGGYSYTVIDTTIYPTTFNDLWLFNIHTKQWTWVSGVSAGTNDTGHYGQKKVPSTLNRISNREGSALWTDLNNNVWVFGGEDVYGNLKNDLWKFTIDTSCVHADLGLTGIALPPDTSLCLGNSIQVQMNDEHNMTFSPSYGVLNKDSALITLSPAVTTTYTLKYTTTCHDTNTIRFTVHVVVPLKPLTDTIICANGSATLPDSGYRNVHVTPSTGVRQRDSTALIFTPDTTTTYVVHYYSPCPGMDSVKFTIHVLPVSLRNISASICHGQTYILPKNEIARTTGVYKDTFTNRHGCDSIITTTLTVLPVSTTHITASICHGQTYMLPNNTIVKDSGTYIDTLTNYVGCDSIITTHLHVHPVYTIKIQTSICQGHTYTLPDNKIVKDSGTYIDTLYSHYGCDSIITTVLKVLHTSSSHVSAAICGGQTYTLPGNRIVMDSGTYVDTLKNSVGCDSIITTALIVHPAYQKNMAASICHGQTYTLPDNEAVNSTGVYADTFKTHYGCDSIITTTLTVYPVYNENVSVSICHGQTYTLPKNEVVNSSGIYVDSLHSQHGCDSIITTTLIVYPVYSKNITASICRGLTYILPGNTVVTDSGTYIDTLKTHYGCDSIITTVLKFLPVPSAAFSFIPPRVIMDVSPSVQLHNESLNGDTFTWLFQQQVFTHIFDTSLLFSSPGDYCFTLRVENGVNCIDTVTHCVSAVDTTYFMGIPNAFTPNDDGKDDVFFPIVTLSIIKIKEFRILDRWGKVLYDNPSRGWDGTYNGKPQPQGTYVYLVVADYAPVNEQSTEVTKRGTVELIR